MKHLKNFHQFPCSFCKYKADSQEELDQHECGSGKDEDKKKMKRVQLRTKVRGKRSL